MLLKCFRCSGELLMRSEKGRLYDTVRCNPGARVSGRGEAGTKLRGAGRTARVAPRPHSMVSLQRRTGFTIKSNKRKRQREEERVPASSKRTHDEPAFVRQSRRNSAWLSQQKVVVSILEAGSPRSGCQQGWFLLRVVEGSRFRAPRSFRLFAGF